MKIARSLPITLLLALLVFQWPGSAAADPYNKMPPPKAPQPKSPHPDASPRPRIPPSVDAVQRNQGAKPGAGSDEDIDGLLDGPDGLDSQPPSKPTTDDPLGGDDIPDIDGEPATPPSASVPPPPTTPPSDPPPAPRAPRNLKPGVADQMTALIGGGDPAAGGNVQLKQTGQNLRTGAQTYEFSVDGKKYVLTVPKDGNSSMVRVHSDGSQSPVAVTPDFGRKAP